MSSVCHDPPMSTEDPAADMSAALVGEIVAATTGPESDALGPAAAAKVLGVSPRRIRALVAAGRLIAVSETPLKVSRASLEVLAAERDAQGITPASTEAATITAEQLAAINKALATLLTEVSALRAEVTSTRAELTAERSQRLEIESAQQTRRRWWSPQK